MKKPRPCETTHGGAIMTGAACLSKAVALSFRCYNWNGQDQDFSNFAPFEQFKNIRRPNATDSAKLGAAPRIKAAAEGGCQPGGQIEIRSTMFRVTLRRRRS